LRRFWRPKEATQTLGSKFRLSYYTQECRCEEASSSLTETWPGFDFKKAVEFCHCCGSQPILTASEAAKQIGRSGITALIHNVSIGIGSLVALWHLVTAILS
jgi:hypothetical protein